MEHDDVQGDQIEMHASLQGVHGETTTEIQDDQRGGMMQLHGDRSEVNRSIQCSLGK